MKIIQVVPTLEQEASGPSYCVPRLAAALAGLGNDVGLYSVGGLGVRIDRRVDGRQFPKDFSQIPVLRALWLSSGLRGALDLESADADIIHSNSLWVMPNVYPGWAVKGSAASLVVSPHGTLGEVPLSYSRWRKRAFWALMQGPAVRSAAALHATCEAEFEEIRRFGLKQPVMIVPNGIDLPVRKPVRDKGDRPRRLLFLARVHRKKGFDLLLEAWRELSSRFPTWELRVVGPGEAEYVQGLEKRVREMGLTSIDFAGARYGADKDAEYAAADLYVLPSYNENFGLTVGEALSFGVPVVTTTGTPWSGLRENRCGWWVVPDAPSVIAALSEAMASTPAELESMGRAGRAWIADAFSWDRIAEQMSEAYLWVLRGGPPPPTIRVD